MESPYPSFELFETIDAFILKSTKSCLWCNRLDGGLIVRSLDEFKNAWEPISLGVVYGCIGKIRLTSDGEWRLLLISHRTPVGQNVRGHEIFRIDRAVAISMAPDDASELDLEITDVAQTVNQKSRLKRLNNPRNVAFLQTLSTYRASQTMKPKKEQKELEKIEKRLLEELLKMFSSDSFFFCPDDDLSSTVQRMNDPAYNASLPVWKRADDRFFWNKHMLSDLMKSENTEGLEDWMMPIIQGHVEMHRCNIVEQTSPHLSHGSAETISTRQNAMSTLSRFARKSTIRQQVSFTEESLTDDIGRSTATVALDNDDLSFKLYVISRRSRFRAGTRFLRRGADDAGATANFVETEQIVVVRTHVVSYVQLRGSIPVYWSQLSLKYRPPPKLDRSDEESHKAFKLHFNDLLTRHQKVVVVNLVDQQGREKVMADAYVKQMDMLRNRDTIYITFDFHEHCKGMHFENVDNLVDAMDPIVREHRYCWCDNQGTLCTQVGILRINCMDCLDRTNVVMAAMARRVLLTVLFKLGLLSPDSTLPTETRSIFQRMWANNGDAISRQYAGTAALKGDFTRTGERSMMGVMKDGYNSASRYYVNHFRDVYRQTVIDLMMGNPVSEDFLRMARSDAIDLANPALEVEEWTMEREESIAFSITKCQQLLVPSECSAEGWAVVEYGPCSGLLDTSDDIDLVLLLVKDSLFIVMYDYDLDDVAQYEKIALEDLHSIQLGVLPTGPKSSQSVFVRLLRRQKGESDYFYTFKPVHSQSSAEAKEILLSIVQSIQEARMRHSLLTLPYHETKLSKSRSKRPNGLVVMSQSQMRHTWNWKPRRNNPDSSASSGTLSEKKRSSNLLGISLASIRRRSPAIPVGTDSEDNLDDAAPNSATMSPNSPQVRLKASGRRMIMQVKRFMRPDGGAGSDSDADVLETSGEHRKGAIQPRFDHITADSAGGSPDSLRGGGKLEEETDVGAATCNECAPNSTVSPEQDCHALVPEDSHVNDVVQDGTGVASENLTEDGPSDDDLTPGNATTVVEAPSPPGNKADASGPSSEDMSPKDATGLEDSPLSVNKADAASRSPRPISRQRSNCLAGDERQTAETVRSRVGSPS